MPTFSDDITAARAVSSRLQTVFASAGTYGSHYSGFGGVDVIQQLDESDEPEHVGKPMVLVGVPIGGLSPWSSHTGNYRDVTTELKVYSSDFAGAQVGTANPVSSDELLTKDLQKEFYSNYFTWEGLGILDVQFTPSQLTTQQGNAGDIRTMSHSVSFKYQLT